MTAYSTQGKRLAVGVQSAFGTPQTTLKDIRSEGAFTIKDPVKMGTVPTTIHADVNETEKPIVLERPVDDAVAFKTYVRQAATAGGDSIIKKSFEAGGLTAVEGDSTTLSAYVSTSDFTVTSDNFEAGYGINLELDNGQFIPILVKANSSGQIDPAMALPSASSATNAANRCVTITPGNTAEIAGSKLETFKGFTRMDVSGTPKTIQWNDCAAVGYDEISLEPGNPILFGFTFGSSGYTEGTAALGNNDFNDGTAAKLFESPYFQFADANATTVIASTLGKLRKATFAPKNTAVQIPSTGDGTAQNDMCGWMMKQDMTDAVLTIEQLWTQDDLDQWNGTNASKHISIIQPGSSASDPSMAIVMPNAHMISEPVIDQAGDMYIVTSSWVGNPAGMDGTGADDQGNQPWYILLGEQSA